MNPRDGDPRVPDGFMLEPRSAAAVSRGYYPRRRRILPLLALVGMVATFVLGFLFHAAVTSAAPRSASVVSGHWTPVRVSHGAPSLLPSPTTGTRPASVKAPPDLRTPPASSIVKGKASFVGPSYGSRYLALPEGPGVTVTICHASRCVTRRSTDAGPDRAMQRAGRVADLSWADFRRLCLCDPYVVGLLRVTVDYGGPGVTPPATDR
jgi:hypothetical protein